MNLAKLELDRLEKMLTLQDYEMVKPLAESLLEKGYDPVRIAAILYQYGFVFGRQILRDVLKEQRRRKYEARNRSKAETECQTSGDNEGSV